MRNLTDNIGHRLCFKNGAVRWNDTLLFHSDKTLFVDFARELYQFLEIDYPKFHKMDALSKLAFLGAEILLKSVHRQGETSDIALLFMNRSASLDTDVRHQQSIADPAAHYPSPAVFVYTLANICLGEVSIRHGLQSESCFFVSDQLDTERMQNYAEYLLQSNKAEKVLCAWVEYFQEAYEAVFYLVEKTPNT